MNDYEYKAPSYDGFNTSPEILRAIEKVAGGGSVLDDESASRALWDNGGREDEIIAALSVDEYDQGDELVWGWQGVFCRFEGRKWVIVNA